MELVIKKEKSLLLDGKSDIGLYGKNLIDFLSTLRFVKKISGILFMGISI